MGMNDTPCRNPVKVMVTFSNCKSADQRDVYAFTQVSANKFIKVTTTLIRLSYELETNSNKTT